MKYILSFLGIVAIGVGIMFCRQKPETTNDDFVRIHITANSNSAQDQNLKYFVKDVAIEYLNSLLGEARSKDDALNIVNKNLYNLEDLINETLQKEGASYGCQISLVQENFPMRRYDDLVVKAGIYDSLKIDLGEAQGDNWWCMVFPAVCFIDSKNCSNIEYISKIWEIINNVT